MSRIEEMLKVFDLVDSTIINNNDSYIQSYPAIISYFQNKETLTPEDFIILSHVAYGWMPTILKIYNNTEEENIKAAELLNKARHTYLVEAELNYLKTRVKNSIIGVSKMLHFIAPDKYPIWDSKIYTFIYGPTKSPHHHTNDVKKYLQYIEDMQKLIDDENFNNFYKKVDAKPAPSIEKMRAAELIMFLNAPKFKE